MSYDRLPPTRYQFASVDFGGGVDVSLAIVGPKGKRGRLYDYGVMGISEAMNGGTLMPRIEVGTATDEDAYGAPMAMDNAINTAVSVRSKYAPTEAGFKALVVQDGGAPVVIPAGTVVILKCLAATGSGLTGQGQPFCDIQWED